MAGAAGRGVAAGTVAPGVGTVAPGVGSVGSGTDGAGTGVPGVAGAGVVAGVVPGRGTADGGVVCAVATAAMRVERKRWRNTVRGLAVKQGTVNPSRDRLQIAWFCGR